MPCDHRGRLDLCHTRQWTSGPPEAEGARRDPPSETSERARPWQHLDFGLVLSGNKFLLSKASQVVVLFYSRPRKLTHFLTTAGPDPPTSNLEHCWTTEPREFCNCLFEWRLPSSIVYLMVTQQTAEIILILTVSVSKPWTIHYQLVQLHIGLWTF